MTVKSTLGKCTGDEYTGIQDETFGRCFRKADVVSGPVRRSEAEI